MSTLISGKKVSRTRMARRAMRNAITRAEAHEDPRDKVATLLRGWATAESWLDGTHPKLATP